MKKYFENLAKAAFGMQFGDLEESEKHVIKSMAEKTPIATDVNIEFDDQLTTGQRMADKVAEFGGSWPFIILFVCAMIVWILINSVWLFASVPFDPYPFILLNLILSTLAALQAPIIMMSQNRQASKDRLSATLNYEVSLKTDLEIMQLHKKIDALQQSLATLNASLPTPPDSEPEQS
ncbi:MAG: DUF1003 domain-containing protein [Aestuariibacter sp.]